MASSTQARILVVEDEQDIRELIMLHLGRDGHLIETAADGEEALRKIRGQGATRPYDLYVLDWMLPGTNGLELTRMIRGEDGPGKSRPVLMVTARAEGADVVLGLEAGADDYVTKPFEIPVLLARVRALLRRREWGAEKRSDIIRVGDVSINQASHEVVCAGQKVELTISEFKLLWALAENRGRVLTRDKLIGLVQGEGVTVVDRAIDTHIFGLRKKLSAASDIVETVRGVGYRVRAAD